MCPFSPLLFSFQTLHCFYIFNLKKKFPFPKFRWWRGANSWKGKGDECGREPRGAGQTDSSSPASGLSLREMPSAIGFSSM